MLSYPISSSTSRLSTLADSSMAADYYNHLRARKVDRWLTIWTWVIFVAIIIVGISLIGYIFALQKYPASFGLAPPMVTAKGKAQAFKAGGGNSTLVDKNSTTPEPVTFSDEMFIELVQFVLLLGDKENNSSTEVPITTSTIQNLVRNITTPSSSKSTEHSPTVLRPESNEIPPASDIHIQPSLYIKPTEGRHILMPPPSRSFDPSTKPIELQLTSPASRVKTTSAATTSPSTAHATAKNKSSIIGPLSADSELEDYDVHETLVTATASSTHSPLTSSKSLHVATPSTQPAFEPMHSTTPGLLHHVPLLVPSTGSPIGSHFDFQIPASSSTPASASGTFEHPTTTSGVPPHSASQPLPLNSEQTTLTTPTKTASPEESPAFHPMSSNEVSTSTTPSTSSSERSTTAEHTTQSSSSIVIPSEKLSILQTSSYPEPSTSTTTQTASTRTPEQLPPSQPFTPAPTSIISPPSADSNVTDLQKANSSIYEQMLLEYSKMPAHLFVQPDSTSNESSVAESPVVASTESTSTESSTTVAATTTTATTTSIVQNVQLPTNPSDSALLPQSPVNPYAYLNAQRFQNFQQPLNIQQQSPGPINPAASFQTAPAAPGGFNFNPMAPQPTVNQMFPF